MLLLFSIGMQANCFFFSVLCVIISKKMDFRNLNFIICFKVVALDQV